ncbi:MAG: dicarboxylate/amino acid:cation symporter [Acidaminococcaceae bacterium]|jgi:Na+/H+-dicarboxylate symporter|nr:dicarboxylate/amino acid:cation symporter [Acidaminococcaceae bacterium]
MSFLKNNKSSFILLASMFIGAGVGAVWGKGALVMQPLADLFLNLLYCCVVPMIFVSIVASISKMESMQKLGRIIGIMMLIFVVTQVFASVYMVGISAISSPGKGAIIQMTEQVKDLKSNMNILAMFTVNDFTLLWSRKNLMALIIAGIMVGTALLSMGERGKNLARLFDEASEMVMHVVNYVMKIAPIGLGVLFATLIGEYGSQFTGPLAQALIVYCIAAVVYYFFSNTLFAYIGAGMEGVKRYYRYCIPPTLTSLGTCSSAATIPLSLEAADKCGISNDVRDLCIPLGANLHKDGACLITILKIAFLCNVLGINFMDPVIIFKAVVCATLASMVMGAIPAGGYVGELFVISLFGFPPATIPVMVLIGTITDAPATAINVTGDLSSAFIVERYINGKDWYKKIAA